MGVPDHVDHETHAFGGGDETSHFGGVFAGFHVQVSFHVDESARDVVGVDGAALFEDRGDGNFRFIEL